MVFPWFSYGFPMVFLRVPHQSIDPLSLGITDRPSAGGGASGASHSACEAAETNGHGDLRLELPLGFKQQSLENLQETMVFTIKLIGLSCKFSHNPIL